ncbi:MAG: hypothetical protein PHO83_09160, partial [Geobacteraceae bacterium]|nr:hypothetical protein [Geobacteraceae bacterium]
YYPIPVSGSSINLDGGDAFRSYSSAGGEGGDIYIDSYTDVKVLKSGTVDVGFSIPSYAYSFGDVKATVSADTDVLLDPEVDPGAGVLYMRSYDPSLYIGDGDDESDVQVTGLSVAAGVTLRFPTNIYGEGDAAYVYIPNAVVINGTVTTIVESLTLDLESGSYLEVGTTGTVTTSGRTAGASSGELYVASYGVAINKGAIESNGATGGGSANYVVLVAQTFVYNTGAIRADGADNAEGAGGSGGLVGVGSYFASVYTSGTLSADGGDGTGENGGSAGVIEVSGAPWETHKLVVGGVIQANGGNGVGGNGNDGGDLAIYTNSGALLLNADISLAGGDSTGDGYAGGDGGYLYLAQSYEDDYGYGEQAPVEGIRIAGNIDLSGGSGSAYGGAGGYFEIETDYAYETAPVATQVEFVGYSSISLNGGSGTEGADAGYFEIYTEDAWTGDDYMAVPVGSIINQVPVSAKGGDGALTGGHYGGNGGYIDFEAEGEFSIGTTEVANSGALDVSGGAGDYAGDSGGVYFYGHDKVSNNATINAAGGNGTSQGGNGAWWYVEFYSTLDIVNSGKIIANGGSGVTGGYGADWVGMYAGSHTTNSGAITANGGAGTIDGGDGGYIDLFSQYVATSNSGTLNVAAGTGGTTATNGIIWIDWVDVTPADGIL